MSVDTRLYLSNRWSLEDVANTIKAARAKEIGEDGAGLVITSNHDIAMGYYTFAFEGRLMNVHSDSTTPLGRCICLSLSHDKHAVLIMRSIAQVLGGFLEIDDCSGQIEMIMGSIYDDDGLQYFLKQATIARALEDDDDIDGLKVFIEDWRRKYGRN